MSEESTAADKPESKPKRRLLLIVAGVLVLAAGGAGAFFVLGGSDEAKEADTPAPVEKAPARFVQLDPPFVVNFQGGSSARFLQIAVQLMTRDEEQAVLLEHLTPIIRNDLLLLFGDKQVAEVSTQEGKESLRLAALEAVRRIIAAEGGKPDALEAVYFTSFVMQ